VANEILVVDMEGGAYPLLSDALMQQGFVARSASASETALAMASEGPFDAVVTELPSGAESDMALFEQLRELQPDVPIVATGGGDVDTVVAALRSGAYDYIIRPAPVDTLVAAVSRAVQHRKLVAEVARLRDLPHLGAEPLIGESPSIKAVKELLLQICDSDATVLITGESGTGKERAARALHNLGPRAARPFVALNSAAMPPNLLESELFGHVRGAFTDAIRARPGLLAGADHGTVFLDEIGDMPLSIQSKLLRALQERRFRPVGSDTELPLKARLIAATNRNLENDVPAGRFRQELYYRINVIQISMPPLRERTEDILPLAQHILVRVAERIEKPVTGIAPTAAEKLIEYSWPGNVRELENCIERAVLLTSFSDITVDDLPERVRLHQTGGEAAHGAHEDLVTLAEMKRRYLRHVISTVRGNKSRAARILDIDRRTLCKHLREDEGSSS
jgi:DNA-binding NtrC family response regulator